MFYPGTQFTVPDMCLQRGRCGLPWKGKRLHLRVLGLARFREGLEDRGASAGSEGFFACLCRIYPCRPAAHFTFYVLQRKLLDEREGGSG